MPSLSDDVGTCESNKSSQIKHIGSYEKLTAKVPVQSTETLRTQKAFRAEESAKNTSVDTWSIALVLGFSFPTCIVMDLRRDIDSQPTNPKA